jgi:hypothetical protein
MDDEKMVYISDERKIIGTMSDAMKRARNSDSFD